MYNPNAKRWPGSDLTNFDYVFENCLHMNKTFHNMLDELGYRVGATPDDIVEECVLYSVNDCMLGQPMSCENMWFHLSGMHRVYMYFGAYYYEQNGR